MIKKGRPSISYEEFKKAWQTLLKEGRATTNIALDLLGGSKSTIIKFREQFEHQQKAQSLALLDQIKLPEQILEVLANIAVDRIEVLERANSGLESRLKEYLLHIEQSEKQCADREVELEHAKMQFEKEHLQWERQTAASEARIDDLKKREQTLVEKLEILNDKYNQALRDAAVIKKENDMLREQLKVN